MRRGPRCPTCDSADPDDCTRRRVTNSHGNGLLHADEFIARAIALAAARDDQYSALLDATGRGGSLGEVGP